MRYNVIKHDEKENIYEVEHDNEKNVKWERESACILVIKYNEHM